MLLKDLLCEDEIDYLSREEILEFDISGISSDSRDIKKGYAFVCIDGFNVSGEAYIADATEHGAVLCITQRPPAIFGIDYVIVKNTRLILSMMLYRFYLGRGADMDIYALTGTNGKTSTGCFLREIFMCAGEKTGFIGTLGAFVGNDHIVLPDFDEKKYATMTTPDPEQLYRIIFEMQKLGVEKLVIEASSHSLKLDKLAPLRFKTSAFMNLSGEHLDFHFDIADYLLSKCRIFDMSEKVVVNSDDRYCSSFTSVFEEKAIPYSINDYNAVFRAIDVVTCGTDGVEYTLCYDSYRMPIKCSVPGIHTVYNSLAAASVALLDNVSPEAVCQGIRNMKKIDGRLEKIYLPDSSFSVFIDYAHTPAAMENLFLTVRSLNSKNGRIITLFGCGGDRDKSKRAPMGRIASLYSDLVIITDDNPRREDPESIIGDILSGIDKTKPYKVVRGREKAIEYAIENARQNDIILLVGKGHEQYEIQNNEIKPFSEKEIVNRIIKSKAGGKNERKI